MEVAVLDHEIPLEYQLFALAFKEPGAISEFAEYLPAEMVGAIHGNTGIHEFYNTLLNFHDKTGLDPVDPIAFRAWLESETEIQDSLGGAGGVSVFMDLVLNQELSTTDSVIKVLKHRANKRKQLDALQELQVLLANKKKKSDKDVERINILTEQIRTLENDLEYNPLANVSTANDIANRADELMEIPTFLPTPFVQLNRAMGYTDEGGYFRGAVHAIVAPSGKGKSTFAKCLVNHWADLGFTTLFINFEEARSHWERILFTQICGENVYAKADQWTDLEKKHHMQVFKDKLNGWGDRFMVRHDPDTSYFDDLERWLRDIIGHNENVPDVVVIDTIQSLLGKGGGPRWADYELMMIKLERLAKEMNAVFILTAQQNTNAAKEKREVIEQHDVGGSISIVQKCAVITVITPKKMVSGDESEDDDNLYQLQIPKNQDYWIDFRL
jgi:KaiC/GvpD/RAD55 family RecA-like ATPase